MSLKLHTIIASTRPGRVGPAVTRWFHAFAERHGRFNGELVDLADFNLPVYDEPAHPRLQRNPADTARACNHALWRSSMISALAIA